MNTNKLTLELCDMEAKKYKSRMEFKEKSSSAYRKSVRNKWLDKICSHMEIKIHKSGHWTYEKCKIEAKKYKSRTEFSKTQGWAYQTALNNGWLDNICRHMKIIGNIRKRCIYAYEFNDNHVYIGLTFNFEKRWRDRLKDENDAVYIHIKKTKNTPKRIQLTEYLDVKSAKKLEDFYVKEYKSKGFIILNRCKTGSLGGNIIKWNYDLCKSIISNYKSLTDFKKYNYNCYSAVHKNGWKELLLGLTYKHLPNNHWNINRCREAAALCKKRTEFYKKYRGAYASATTNKWLDDVTKHMEK